MKISIHNATTALKEGVLEVEATGFTVDTEIAQFRFEELASLSLGVEPVKGTGRAVTATPRCNGFSLDVLA